MHVCLAVEVVQCGTRREVDYFGKAFKISGNRYFVRAELTSELVV